ncbi:MAG TPA: DUF6607 family protein [Polyangiaceae bacterium]|jgi:hypothetical protein|nr:DUF6607 family protein [Polyangiaceae bacterium]
MIELFSGRGLVRGSVLLLGAALGCAGPAPSRVVKQPVAGEPACRPDRDREAISAMAGQFRVSFAFDETESMAEGYRLHAPYRAKADEVVEILEASERKIVLQHVLLVSDSGGKSVAMKHWRQDWTFEDSDLLEFRGQRTWERRVVAPADVACSWSQAVFEVDDGPRYESFGRWSHGDGTSTWSSQETWRPLPRREYTKRSDYDLLLGRNAHVVTTTGWVHEQTNLKVVLDTNRTLAREHGVNRYERVSLKDGGLVRSYLDDTAAFWRGVREEWQHVFASFDRFTVLADVEGKPLHEWLAPLADRGRAGPSGERRADARDVIARFVHAAARPPNRQSLR